jgi:hypothetical protein
MIYLNSHIHTVSSIIQPNTSFIIHNLFYELQDYIFIKSRFVKNLVFSH